MEEDTEMAGDEASDGSGAGTSKDGQRQAGQQRQQQQVGWERGMAVAPDGSDTEDDDEGGDVTDNDSLGGQ